MPPDTSSGLRLILAPRTEPLLDALIEGLEPAPTNPMARECILVQNRGMARWLELQLSARLEVWANPWFPFPEELVRLLWWDLQRPEEGARPGRFDRETLVWSVAALLPELIDQPEMQPLRGWLGSSPEPGRVLSLSRRIAGVLDGYLLSRPELLLQWEEDPETARSSELPAIAEEDARWQARLWRELVARAEPDDAPHPARRAQQILTILDGLSPGDGRLWRFPRVFVFGLSALSPLYLRILASLARHVPVRLYSLAPSPADAERMARAAESAGWTGDAVVTEEQVEVLLTTLEQDQPSHPLLIDQGRAAREFQMLAARAGADFERLPVRAGAALEQQSSGHVDEPTLLSRLQSELAAGTPAGHQPGLLRACHEGQDRSIGLHSCHGALREVEVLRDQLLDAFETMDDLAPHEVVVMLPDVEAYAPYVEAVFSMGYSAGQRIPFRIADREPGAERPGVQAVLRALHLLRGRMTAPELLDLLSMPALRRAQGLDEEALELLRDWIEAAGIRWGLDAEHRAAVGQPPLAENSWRWGLTRLALGWAAPGDSRGHFEGLLPETAAAGEPLLLGSLAEVFAMLDRWRDELLEARLGIPAWAERLRGMLVELLGRGAEAEEDRRLIESSLGRLVERAERAGYRQALGLDAVTNLLESALAEDPPARGFLEGAVTVCALQPMRSIPFRVVAIAGLNDGIFPRGDHPPGFDLAARRPRLGDNPRRETDRLLFLEALCSARERLILCWTGRDAQRDIELPPSVVVSELLDALERMDGEPESARALVLEHPMQAFSPRYFEGDSAEDRDPRFFSFAADYASTAASGLGSRGARPPFLQGELDPLPPEADSGPREVSIDRLTYFLESPARRLLRDRLGIDPPRQDAPLEDREPMALDGLQQYLLAERMLEARLDGATPEEALAIAGASGRLPLGTPGRLALRPLQTEVENLLALADPLRSAPRARSRAVEIDLDLGIGGDVDVSGDVDVGGDFGGINRPTTLRLAGRLDGLWPAGRVEIGYGKPKLSRELRLWLRHLCWNAAAIEDGAEEPARDSWAIGRAKKGDAPALIHLAPVAEARELLTEIIAGWLEAERGLWPFFPEASRAYFEAISPELRAREPARRPSAAGAAAGADAAEIEEALLEASRSFGSHLDEASSQAGRYGGSVDLDDAYLAQVLGSARPWDADHAVVDPQLVDRFAELALRIWTPFEAAAERFEGEAARAWIEERIG